MKMMISISEVDVAEVAWRIGYVYIQKPFKNREKSNIFVLKCANPKNRSQ